MRRLLVVDANPMTRLVIQRCLQGTGVQVDAHATLATATRAGDGVADLLVLVRPAAVDLARLRRMTRRVPDMPCLVVTPGPPAFDLILAATRASVAAVLPQPFTCDELTGIVEAVLQREPSIPVARGQLVGMLRRATSILHDPGPTAGDELQRHCDQIAVYTEAVARRLGFPRRDIAALRLGASLHDVGKLGLPDFLLTKPGRLDDREWSLMRRHTEVGSEVIPDAGAWDIPRDVVRYHHERWDGDGYPAGLRKTQIPAAARVVGVVDALDVMLTGRPYAPRHSLDHALADIGRNRGRQFDPDCVDALVAAVEEGAIRVPVAPQGGA